MKALDCITDQKKQGEHLEDKKSDMCNATHQQYAEQEDPDDLRQFRLLKKMQKKGKMINNLGKQNQISEELSEELNCSSSSNLDGEDSHNDDSISLKRKIVTKRD